MKCSSEKARAGMEEMGVKLQKAVLMMMSIVWVLGMSSCEDRLDSPCPSTGEGKTVEVSLCVGLADWRFLFSVLL